MMTFDVLQTAVEVLAAGRFCTVSVRKTLYDSGRREAQYNASICVDDTGGNFKFVMSSPASFSCEKCYSSLLAELRNYEMNNNKD